MAKKKVEHVEQEVVEAGTDITKAMDMISINANVGLDDIVAVKVAEIESGLIRQQTETTQAIEKLSTDNEKVRQSMKKLVAQMAIDTFKTPLELAAAQFRTLSEAKVVISYDSGWHLNDGKVLYIGVVASLRMGQYDAYRNESAMHFRKELPPSAEFLDLYNKSEEMCKQATQLHSRMVLIRDGLSRIASYERQTRGQVAKMRLNSTDSGRELLQALASNTAVAGLPQIPELPSA